MSFSSNKFPKKNNIRIHNLIRNLCLIIFIYFLIFLNINKDGLSAILKIEFLTILKGLALIIFGYFIRFLRWRILLNQFNYNLPFFHDLRIWLSSFAFTVTPGKSGEFIRCFFLQKEFKVNPLISSSSVVFERFTDAFAVLVIIFFNISFLPTDLFKHINTVLGFVFGFLIIIIFILKIKKFVIFDRIKRIIFKFFIISYSQEYLKYYSVFFKIRIFFITIILSLISWSLEGVSLYLILIEFGVKINLSGSIFAHTASGLLGALSISPGGIGTAEVSNVALLSIQKVPIEISIKACLLIRLMTIWFATFIGLICINLPEKNEKAKEII